MAETVTFTFTVKPGEYSLIRSVINDGMGGIRLNHNKDNRYGRWQRSVEDYYIPQTKCGLFYDGQNALTIKGLHIEVIKTKRDLEWSGAELRLVAV